MEPISKSKRTIHSAYTQASNAAKNPSTEKWVENFARAGFISKGVVYTLIGTLAAMAAFGIGGGQVSSMKEIFKFIYEQPFGKFLLGILAIGLVGYVVWRFIQAIKNPDHETGTSGKVKRVGYAISGLIYASAAFFAGSMVLNGGSSGGSGGSGGGKEMLISKALGLPMGQWIVGIVALIIAAKGVVQIFNGVKGKYMDDVNEAQMEPKEQKAYKRAGLLGFVARGIVFVLAGYFVMRAAIEYNPSAARGTEGALSFLQNSAYGSIVMGAVALGLVCYGIFMYVKARYKTFNTA